MAILHDKKPLYSIYTAKAIQFEFVNYLHNQVIKFVSSVFSIERIKSYNLYMLHI